MITRAWSAQAPSRRLVTTAVALAIALVVFATGSYHAIGTRSAVLARDLLGTWDLVVRPQIALRPQLSEELARALRADPRVARVVRTQVVGAEIEDVADTDYYDAWPVTVIALAEDALAELHDGRWPASSTDGDVVEGVLSGGHASRWRVTTGDKLPLHAPGGTFTLHVIGTTVERIAHADASGVFVAAAAIPRLTGARSPSDRFYVDLVGDAEADAVLADWQPRLAASDPPATASDLTGFAREIGMDGAFRRLRLLGAGGGALVLIAALFIVGTALAAGADARTRELALLRTVGATRAQVAGLVLREAVLLAVRAALLGVPLGLILLAGLGAAQRDLFGGPLLPHLPSLLLALTIVAVGVLIAAARPAWRAARTAPLAALRASTPLPAAGVPWVRSVLAGVAGLVAIAALQPTATAVLGPLAAAGCALMALIVLGLLGFPLLLIVVARGLGPLLARAGGLPGDLLRRHQDTGLRRACGIATTLAVCLGASVLLNAWGRSMVTPFLPSPQLSDQVISLLPSGVPPEHTDAVRAVPGIIGDRVVPLRVEQTFLGLDLIARSGGDPDAFTVQILGCDPQVLRTGGEAPLLPIEGEAAPQELADALAEPLTCLIPPTLAQRFALAPGTTVNVLHASGRHEVSLRVGGIAALPGWQWVSKMGRMRTLSDKPMAAILVSNATAAALGIDRVRHWLADTHPDADLQGMRQALQDLAETHAAASPAVIAGPVHITRPSVKMIATGEIARRMRERSDAVIWVLGALPLATLFIAMLGVATAVSAGIRARRTEWALLRSIGLTAVQLRRLILCEVLVIVAAAALVSVALGLAAAAAALDASVQIFGTGTATPPLVVPWLDMVVATVITTLAALAAAWLPARRLAHTPPVALLREARRCE